MSKRKSPALVSFNAVQHLVGEEAAGIAARYPNKIVDVKNKWENNSWGRKLIVQKRRATLNDFDRFKVMLAKIKRGGAIRQELAKLKKQSLC